MRRRELIGRTHATFDEKSCFFFSKSVARENLTLAPSSRLCSLQLQGKEVLCCPSRPSHATLSRRGLQSKGPCSKFSSGVLIAHLFFSQTGPTCQLKTLKTQQPFLLLSVLKTPFAPTPMKIKRERMPTLSSEATPRRLLQLPGKGEKSTRRIHPLKWMEACLAGFGKCSPINKVIKDEEIHRADGDFEPDKSLGSGVFVAAQEPAPE